VIPHIRKLPDLLESEHFAPGAAVNGLPLLQGIFRPEETDRRSGKDYILVPSSKWHEKMDYFAGADDLALPHTQRQGGPGMGAYGSNRGFACPERGHDSKTVPGAVRLVGRVVDFDLKGRGDCGKGVRHADGERPRFEKE